MLKIKKDGEIYCSKHPGYVGARAPLKSCEECHDIWYFKSAIRRAIKEREILLKKLNAKTKN